jgi:hypothetical protein
MASSICEEDERPISVGCMVDNVVEKTTFISCPTLDTTTWLCAPVNRDPARVVLASTCSYEHRYDCTLTQTQCGDVMTATFATNTRNRPGDVIPKVEVHNHSVRLCCQTSRAAHLDRRMRGKLDALNR